MNNLAQWKGSEETAKSVKEQIRKRFGEQEAKKYNPLKNCFTFRTWIALGYHVKKGEKALRSITLIDKQVTENGIEKKVRFPKTVCLFYQSQVEK